MSNWLYVLELENDKYYVGISCNLANRLSAHRRGEGAKWTKVHKMIRVAYKINIDEDKDNKMEQYITLSLMALLGWKNVRGYAWSQENMKNAPIVLRE